ncbi:MAG: DUF721 domain-containing protein [Actinobacteria bacterium]|nr:DUF721 domain-containing protein [Actinomycetota bacterium]
MPEEDKKNLNNTFKKKAGGSAKKKRENARVHVPGINASLPTVSDIQSILKIFAADPQINLKMKKYSLFNHWPEIVGKEIADKTAPLKIFKTTLYVSVTTPTWANELSMMSRQLIDRINAFTGENSITELRFKI